MSKLYQIKYMVCDRCIAAIDKIFSELGSPPISTVLGKVEVAQPISHIGKLKELLEAEGFELLQTAEEITIDAITDAVNDLAHDTETLNSKIKLSDYVASSVGISYNKLSKVFSASQNTTIEKYFIKQKIARAKMLLKDKSLSAREIGYLLGYSSTQYLHKQFREESGMAMKDYRAKA